MRKIKMDLGLPEKLEFHHHGSYIEIVRRWWRKSILFFTAFVVFWNFPLILMLYAVLTGKASLMVIQHIFVHVVIGVSLTYFVIAKWINKTYIYVSAQKIAVQQKPIPWWGNKKISASDVKQLYAKERVSNSGEGRSVSNEVYVITYSGKNTKLVGDLDSSEQALFIEQEIEKLLNIEDLPVKGEIGNLID